MIYFDGVHLATDGPIEELHDAAAAIGLKHAWFQGHRRHPHYDVFGNRASMLEPNCTARELVRMCFSRAGSVPEEAGR